jgi:hypothetical protein
MAIPPNGPMTMYMPVLSYYRLGPSEQRWIVWPYHRMGPCLYICQYCHTTDWAHPSRGALYGHPTEWAHACTYASIAILPIGPIRAEAHCIAIPPNRPMTMYCHVTIWAHSVMAIYMSMLLNGPMTMPCYCDFCMC